MLQRTTCRLWHVKKGLPGVCASYSRLSPPSLPPRSSLSFVQLTTGRTQAIDLALRYHTGVNKGPDNGRAGRRILPLVQNLPNIGPSRHDTLSPAGSFDSPSLNYSGRRHFSAFPSVGPTGPGGSGPGGPGNFPWLGATIVLGGGALALVLLFALGKFILIGILFVGALLLMMKTTRSTSIGRHLSRSVGINPNSLTGKQILSSIVDSALIRLGKRMLADQYANLTFHGLLQQKLNESIAVQEKLGPVILTDFSKEDVYDEEPGIRVEGEIRNINGRIVGWLYSQSGVQEVSMLERKGIKDRLVAAWEKIREGGKREEKPKAEQEDLSDTLQRAVEAVPEYIYTLNQLEIHVTSPVDEDEVEEIIDLTTSVSGEYRAVEFAPDWEDIQDDIPSEYIDTFEKFYKSRQEYYRRHTSPSDPGSGKTERRHSESSGPSVIDVEYREKK
eukprot:gb/GECG01013129.1/.p1 GENE.gb/GECG01013129.1/~~gb/GECG01013129.1/.p1  ORF type:complete len:445 (+),score=50.84 gb/GECG01013129.1/:1-1335(+)